MNRPVLAVLALTTILTGTIIAIWVLNDPEHARPPHVEPPVAAALAPSPLAAVGGETPEAAIQIGIAIIAEEEARAREAVEEAERLAAARRAREQRVAGPGGSPVPASGGPGECDGVAWVVPVGIVARESGCRFDAQSPPSFCGWYGCVGAYQFDSRHWDPGSWGGCADLGDWHDPEAQHECARRLSRGGTNLAPWGQ